MLIDPVSMFCSGVELWMKLERGRITEAEYKLELKHLLARIQEANDAWEAAEAVEK